MEDRKAAVNAIVAGMVQGVGFRYSAVIQARKLGLTGYAANLADGTVAVFAEGPQAKLEHLTKWLHIGPPSARVSEVTFTYAPYQGLYRGFNVKY